MKIIIPGKELFYGADPSTMRTAGILRRNMTLAELLLWHKLKDRKLFAEKFRRQHPIKFFIADFYCHQYKLVIEVDGEVHNDDEAKEYDLNRTAELNKLGLTVIRFSNDQITYDIKSVLSEIHKVIEELNPK